MRKLAILGLAVALAIVGLPVVAQAAPVVAVVATLLQIIPGDSLIVMILNAGLTLALPVAATYVFTEISKAVLKAAQWDAFAKRVLVFAWSTVIAGINHALGLQLPEAWGVISQPEVLLFFTTGLTYLAHKILNTPRAKR
jgi:hypothetical protein